MSKGSGSFKGLIIFHLPLYGVFCFCVFFLFASFLFLHLFFDIVFSDYFMEQLRQTLDGLGSCASRSDSLISLSYLMAVFSTKSIGLFFLCTTYLFFSRNKLQQSIEPWLQNSGKLVYDQTWGGIVDQFGINDPGANFGMGYYNDHHFHFGYFVFAAAVIAKERPDFVQTYGSAIINLIRDYSNPAVDSKDPHFTFMRNKDWFVGN